ALSAQGIDMLASSLAPPAADSDDPAGFLHDPIGYLANVYRRHGPGVTPAPGREDFVFALGPECNEAIYLHPDVFVATGFLFPGPRNSAQRRLLAGIFNQSGERHRDHRRLMMPTFQKQAVASHYDAMVAGCQVFLAGWHKGEVRDVSAAMLDLVTRLNSRILLGVDPEDDDLIRDFEAATESWMALNTPLTVAGSLSLDLPRSWYDDALASSERVERLTKQVLDLRRSRPPDSPDLLTQLLRAHAADPVRLTGLELVGQTAHLFAAS